MNMGFCLVDILISHARFLSTERVALRVSRFSESWTLFPVGKDIMYKTTLNYRVLIVRVEAQTDMF